MGIARSTYYDEPRASVDDTALGACAAERFWAPSDTIGSGNE